jgi:NAD kinase
MFDKVVVVTKKTLLEELIERFNTRDQARFYIEQMGVSFAEYQNAHDTYLLAVAAIRSAIPSTVRSQFLDRAYLPSFTFGEDNLVVSLGPDGLVVNIAKYLDSQPLLPLNPDPKRIDGVLIPFQVSFAATALQRVLGGFGRRKQVTMAKVTLNDGLSLYGFNDLFIGQRSHQSARYRIELNTQAEDQSSSGVIVSTGAGSTGWLRSVLTGAAQVVQTYAEADEVEGARAVRDKYAFDWESTYLQYSVREPFISKTTSAEMVCGRIEQGQNLQIISAMPQNGVIFSDGIEEDYLPFNSGATASIGVAEKRANLVVGL